MQLFWHFHHFVDKQSFHFNFSGTDIKFLLNFFSRNIIIFNCVFVPFSHRSKSLKLFFVDCKNLSLLLLPNITITLLLLLLFSFSTMALYNSLKNFIIFVTFVRCWEQEVEKSPIICYIALEFKWHVKNSKKLWEGFQLVEEYTKISSAM